MAKAEYVEDRKLDRDIRIALRGFIPVFGDTKHLAIVKTRGKIIGMEKDLKEKKEAQKGGQKLSEELLSAKRSLLWQLEQLKKK